MIRCLKFEFKRMFRNPAFWIALAIGTIIMILQVIVDNHEYIDNPLKYYMGAATYPATLYYKWAFISGFLNAYLFIFPIVVASAYGITYYWDLKSGYVKNVLINMKRKDYLVAKYIVTFVSGGLVFTIPMIINFAVNAAVLPAIKPFLGSTYMRSHTFLVELAYNNPIMHFIIFMLIYFVYGGLFACLVLAGSKIFRNSFLLALFPFAISYLLTVVSKLWFENIADIGSIAPSKMLFIGNSFTSWIAVVGLAVVLLVTSFLIYYLGGRRSDVI